MMVSALCISVVLMACTLAGLVLGGVTFWPALWLSWGIGLVAFLLVCLVGWGADVPRWRDE